MKDGQYQEWGEWRHKKRQGARSDLDRVAADVRDKGSNYVVVNYPGWWGNDVCPTHDVFMEWWHSHIQTHEPTIWPNKQGCT